MPGEKFINFKLVLNRTPFAMREQQYLCSDLQDCPVNSVGRGMCMDDVDVCDLEHYEAVCDSEHYFVLQGFCMSEMVSILNAPRMYEIQLLPFPRDKKRKVLNDVLKLCWTNIFRLHSGEVYADVTATLEGRSHHYNIVSFSPVLYDIEIKEPADDEEKACIERILERT